MDKYSILPIIDGKNKDAIKNGNTLPGFMGVDMAQFNKDELTMLCNILYDELQQCKFNLSDEHRKLFTEF